MNPRSKLANDPGVQAAKLASKFARELGLPFGNMWEPGIARRVEAQIREGWALSTVEAAWRLRLGLGVAATNGETTGRMQ